ncbi:MAG: dynamin family protein [Actinomycetota bacterium]|nr:dynamin family protein [Actinomycetota bacterium]
MSTSTEADALTTVELIAAAAEGSPHTVKWAQRLRATAARLDGDGVRVVVAGETKRGKSALINALLGVPDLVPVDTSVCTATHVVLSYAAHPSASVVRTEDDTVKVISLDEVGTWVTAEGVRAVRIGIAAPLLREGVELIDTPGVGGLVAAHAQVTLAALAGADALVFVLDLATPITAPELHFLSSAAERIDTVVLAATHSDLYLGSAVDEILAATRAAVAAKIPRLADVPIVAVSSTLRTRFGDDDPTDESGFGALTSELRERVVQRGRDLRLANTLRVALGVVASVQLTGVLALNAVSDPAQRERLATEATRLQELIEGRGTWAVKLSDLMQQTRFDAERMLSSRQAEIRRRYDKRLDKFDRRLRDSLAEEITAELRAFAADLGSTLDSAAQDVMTAMAKQYALDRPDVPAAGELRLSLQTDAMERGRPDMQLLYFAQMPMFTLERPLMIIASNVGLTAASGWWLGPLGIVGGAAVGLVMLRTRMKAAGQQKAKELVRTALNDAVGELRLELQRRVFELQSAIRDGVREAYEQELASVQQARTHLKQVIDADEAKQAQIKGELRLRLASLRELQKKAEEILAGVTMSRAEVAHAR